MQMEPRTNDSLPQNIFHRGSLQDIPGLDSMPQVTRPTIITMPATCAGKRFSSSLFSDPHRPVHDHVGEDNSIGHILAVINVLGLVHGFALKILFRT
ncbi:hypothetical protein LY76DRAFT_590028 [Colletotrichum caudatum]|nr:hypothetical protein LY76DRAFT_590028 [Colletotrichum caudatum]